MILAVFVINSDNVVLSDACCYECSLRSYCTATIQYSLANACTATRFFFNPAEILKFLPN